MGLFEMLSPPGRGQQAAQIVINVTGDMVINDARVLERLLRDSGLAARSAGAAREG